MLHTTLSTGGTSLPYDRLRLEGSTMPEGTLSRSQLLRTYNQDEFPGWYDETREEGDPSAGLPVLDTYPVVVDLAFNVGRGGDETIIGSATLTLSDGTTYGAGVWVNESDLDSNCVIDTQDGDMSKVLKIWLDHFIVGLLENDDLEDGEFSIVRWNDLPA